jgi:O-antigen ligase
MVAQLSFMRTANRVPVPADGAALFVGHFAAYVVILGIATVGQSGLMKLLANVYAVVIFGLMAFAWMTRSHPPSRWSTAAAIAMTVYLTGIVCSLIVNPDRIEWTDLVKLTLGPVFLIFGAAFERSRGDQPVWRKPMVKLCFSLLIVVPLITWGAQLLENGFDIESVRETSIFANRNNAAVYAVTMLGLYTVLAGKPLRSPLLVLCVGVMFGTMGVLLAVLIALLLTVGKWRDAAFLAFIIAAGWVGYWLFPQFGPFARFTPVIDSIGLLIGGQINLRTVSFGQLTIMLHTSDLSFIFRLKHWVDLWYEFMKADFYHLLFGYGVGSSIRLSEMHLVPHNDYLRYLFEFGVVTFTGFVALIGLILVRCGRRWETVPLLAACIYLVSENLITNYTAMAFFYFTAGALAERIGAAKQAAAQSPTGQQ